MQGSVDPPRPNVTLDFKRDFNATGDGVTDDSAAWAMALSKCQGGESWEGRASSRRKTKKWLEMMWFKSTQDNHYPHFALILPNLKAIHN